MKILICTDSSVQIGTGHVMRCLTLADADELRGRGAEAVFVCREFAGNLCGYIEEKGYVIHRLPVSDAPEQGFGADFKHAACLARTASSLPQQRTKKTIGLVNWL